MCNQAFSEASDRQGVSAGIPWAAIRLRDAEVNRGPNAHPEVAPHFHTSLEPPKAPAFNILMEIVLFLAMKSGLGQQLERGHVTHRPPWGLEPATWKFQELQKSRAEY